MISVKLPANLDEIFRNAPKQIIQANDAAITVAAARALPPLRAAQPVGKTGQLQSQTVIKLFRTRSPRMLGAALKVIGDRHFVSHILEYGAASHGGRGSRGIFGRTRRVRAGASPDRGPIAARHTFERVWRSIESQIRQAYNDTFSKELAK